MKKQLSQAVELYESFREAKPRKLARMNVKIPRVVACMGHVEGIDYRTTHGKKVTLYRHKFAAGSRPLLCVSSDGRQLMLLGGLYQWTDRGIVDRDARGRERPDPKHGKRINPRKPRKSNPAAAYRTLVKNALAAGYRISVFDGEEWQVQKSTKFQEIIDAIESVEEAQLRIWSAAGAARGAIIGSALILPHGVGPDETVADYTDNEAMNRLVGGRTTNPAPYSASDIVSEAMRLVRIYGRDRAIRVAKSIAFSKDGGAVMADRRRADPTNFYARVLKELVAKG
jgi:hypothetical protein